MVCAFWFPLFKTGEQKGRYIIVKKAGNIIGKVLTALILAFAVFVMLFTVISVNTVGKENASFLGYKPNIVLSDSMKDTFAVGDLAVTKSTPAQELEAGDIVTFKSIDPANYGAVVTHKIREITTYEGEPAFVTYGTTTGVDDAYPVPFDQVIGEYRFRLPKMGYFFEFLTSPAGYFTIILIPFLLLIGLQAVKFFKLVRQYKTEQQAELEAQRAEVEAQRLETQQMKEELERLRAQMGGTPPEAGKMEDISTSETVKQPEEDIRQEAPISADTTGGDQ